VWRSVLLVDGARNATFPVIAVNQSDFAILFPDGTDVAFAFEVDARVAPADRDAFWTRVFRWTLDKRSLAGLDGTLHLDASPCHPDEFPTRREIDTWPASEGRMTTLQVLQELPESVRQ
jgi:hypothetical protein